MEITSARIAGNELCLTVPRDIAGAWINKFKPGEHEIRAVRKKRSLDANAYSWCLIDKIAAAMSLPKVAVYRNAIREIGGVSETVCVINSAVEHLCSGWSSKGQGWQVQAEPSKIEGCTNVTLYFGSSSYDSRQMSVLIDSLVADCAELGIETLPPDKLAAMTEEWGK